MVVTLKFLISSEKSLQVQLDYSVIINHIQHALQQILFTCLPSPKRREAREERAARWLRWEEHLHNIQCKGACREWFVQCVSVIPLSNWTRIRAFYSKYSISKSPFTGPFFFFFLEINLSTVTISGAELICCTQTAGDSVCFSTCRFVETSRTWNLLFVQYD